VLLDLGKCFRVLKIPQTEKRLTYNGKYIEYWSGIIDDFLAAKAFSYIS
jgi:hypothetical protein